MPLNAIVNGLSTLARMETMATLCSTCKHSIVRPADVVVRDLAREGGRGRAVWAVPLFPPPARLPNSHASSIFSSHASIGESKHKSLRLRFSVYLTMPRFLFTKLI